MVSYPTAIDYHWINDDDILSNGYWLLLTNRWWYVSPLIIEWPTMISYPTAIWLLLTDRWWYPIQRLSAIGYRWRLSPNHHFFCSWRSSMVSVCRFPAVWLSDTMTPGSWKKKQWQVAGRHECWYRSDGRCLLSTGNIYFDFSNLGPEKR